MQFRSITTFAVKRNVFSVIVFSLLSILSIKPVFAQVDYFYGANTKGWRVSLGVGGTKLDANWSSNPVQVIGVGAVDYDVNPYLSFGVEGSLGMLNGVDGNNKLYFKSTEVTESGGDINFKLAVGEFTKLQSKNIFHDVLKRFYVGSGIGLIYSSVVLKPHYDSLGLPAASEDYSGFIQGTTKVTGTGSGSFAYVPLNIGTYIPLRRLTKSDKFEINLNYQYCFVLSPVFDGYQPNASKSVTPYNNGGAVNGNEGFESITVGFRYKF